MSHVSMGRTMLTAGTMAALIAGAAPGAAASHGATPSRVNALKQGAHPCEIKTSLGVAVVDDRYCHDAAGKAKPIEMRPRNADEMPPKANIRCSDHIVRVKFPSPVTKSPQEVLFTGTGAFDNCTSPSNKLPKVKSARLVLVGNGTLALESVPTAPGSGQSACHAAGVLTGTATLIWYDQKGQKGKPIGTTKVDFGRRVDQGVAGLYTKGKVTQASPGVSDLQGNEVTSTLKPQPGQCPEGLDELQVDNDADFHPAPVR